MAIISMIFQLFGSLAFLLYGMKLMSEGIQKSAGESLHRILSMMTSNRFLAVLTGILITMIIQSSGATTVMVVSFVNAGLLTLTQSVGIIFGANIGTTITAWIVSLFGFEFKIALFAIPLFGAGFFLTFSKSLRNKNIGEAIMGFGLLFTGLDLLSSSIPAFKAEDIAFLQFFTDKGFLGIFVGVIIGMAVTVLLHSSSASTAIIITMAYKGLLTWEMSAAMVLGSNIGSTIDAVLAAIGTKVNARRAALVHVLFNVSGTILAVIFLNPLLKLVDFLVPGSVHETITISIAMLHTIFNVLNTLLFLPFVPQIARFAEFLIKPKKDEKPTVYTINCNRPGIKANPEAYVFRAQKEIQEMTSLVLAMFQRIQSGFEHRNSDFIADHFDEIARKEDYADQMQEQLTNFLVAISQTSLSYKTRNNVSLMIRIVDDLESMTDECFSLALLLKRSIDKKMNFSQEDMDRLLPYVGLANQFLNFIKDNINKHLNKEQLEEATRLENQIDAFRKNLKRVARKRLEAGADVRSELLYIDLVRNIEKLGDHAFSISEALAQTK